MADQISRQAAIALLDKWSGGYDYIEIPTKDARESFIQLPPAQPEITEDDVKEWLHKRHLVAIDNALYMEMKRKCAGCCYEPVEGVY